MKFRIAVILTIALAITFTFQNCGPGFKTASPESFSAELGSNIPVNVGSNKTNPFICPTGSEQGKKPMLRLTREQYSNTLKNLVGSTIHTQALPAISSLYSDVLKKSVNDFSNTITDTQMTAYQSIAEVVYNALQANTTAAQALAGSCITQTTVTTACRDNFIKSFGLKAFRRPLEAAEVTRWATQVFALGESGPESVALTAYGMMMSPYFLMKTELGNTASAETTTFNLTPYEVAARLSYDLTDSPPDQMLMAAAAANQLQTSEQLKTHVDRLMASALGRAKVLAFFSFWLDPQSYGATAYTSDFLQGLDVTAVNNEFEREMNQYIDHMVFTRNASLEELLTSRESFARTPAVAAIYGHAPVAAGGNPAMTGMERKGLLMRGPILASEGNETHPILRGVKVRTRILCENLGLPSGVLTNDPTFFSDSARTRLSTRARTEGLTSDASCMACHQSINPAGFAFENFDGLGRLRSVEKAYALNGTLLAEHAINTSSSGIYVGGSQTRSIRDGLDLIDGLLAENKMPACFLRQSFRYYRVQIESADDSCVLNEAYNKLMVESSNGPLLEALKATYLHKSLLTRRIQ